MTKIAVTGSSGFVGSLLCKILKVPYENRFDILESIQPLRASGTNSKDITQENVMDILCEKCEVIVHLAAISGIKQCEQSPSESFWINTKAVLNLAGKAKISGVKRFIFASSSAVYGEAQFYKMDENHPTQPRSLYGKQKLEAEGILKLADKDFEVIILRKSNLYGYGLVWKGFTVIDKFIEALIAGLPMRLTGNGGQKRDFLHVVDAVKIYAKLATMPKLRSGIYNLGGLESMSVRAIAEMVNDYGEQILGKRVGLEFVPTANETLWHDFKYDFSKARMEFNYQPFMTIDDYVKERLLMELRK